MRRTRSSVMRTSTRRTASSIGGFRQRVAGAAGRLRRLLGRQQRRERAGQRDLRRAARRAAHRRRRAPCGASGCGVGNDGRQRQRRRRARPAALPKRTRRQFERLERGRFRLGGARSRSRGAMRRNALPLAARLRRLGAPGRTRSTAACRTDAATGSGGAGGSTLATRLGHAGRADRSVP